MKPECMRTTFPHPVAASCLDQVAGSDNIGLDKLQRPIDREVNMGFGRQMHHCIGIVLTKD